MGAGERRTADQEMAQRLKAQGTTRTTSRCCICHNLISTGAKGGENGRQPDVMLHLLYQCQGSKRKGSGGRSVFMDHSISKSAQPARVPKTKAA